jgi:hypothetical protein
MYNNMKETLPPIDIHHLGKVLHRRVTGTRYCQSLEEVL